MIDASVQSRDPEPNSAELFVRVTCDGIVIGTARFERADGLAYALFRPDDGYHMIEPAARAIGLWLARTRCLPSIQGDFADLLASQWTGRRLALEDSFGRELAVNGVIVADAIHESGRQLSRWVFADFRTDAARVPASQRSLDRGDDGANSHPGA